MGALRSEMDAPPSPERRFRDCIWGETARDRRNNKRFTAAVFIWLAFYVGADLIQEKTAISDGGAWALALLPTLPAIGVFLTYIRFLRETDEMVRRIQCTGLAIGFAAGAFVVVGIQAPGLMGDRIFDKEMVLVAMMLGWVGGVLWGGWRIR